MSLLELWGASSALGLLHAREKRAETTEKGVLGDILLVIFHDISTDSGLKEDDMDGVRIWLPQEM